MIKLFKALYLFLLFGISLNSCLDDVPHENPLDTENKNQGFSISGRVTTLYSPVSLIANAVITLQPGNNKFFSASNGTFQIEGIEPGNYTAFCTADGYGQDSIQIDLQSNMTNIQFFLDGLPFFEDIALETHHVSHFFPVEDMFFLQVDVQVNDLDGIADINTVFFEIPELNVTDTLSPSLETGRFNKRLSIDDLPINTIQTLIGHAFILSVKDDASIIVNSDKSFLTRVIEITPVLLNPINLQTVLSDSIHFSWEKVRLPYYFKHTIEIFRINQGLLTKVDDVKDISSNNVDTAIDNVLPTGDYVWILTVTDEFGNSSSSKEGTFHVN
jgi:hypothetical protein